MSTQSDSPTTESIEAQERLAKPTLSLRRAVPGYLLAIVGTAALLYVAGHSGGTLDNPVGSRAVSIRGGSSSGWSPALRQGTR